MQNLYNSSNGERIFAVDRKREIFANLLNEIFKFIPSTEVFSLVRVNRYFRETIREKTFKNKFDEWMS